LDEYAFGLHGDSLVVGEVADGVRSTSSELMFSNVKSSISRN
jgi:hypothetical protein